MSSKTSPNSAGGLTGAMLFSLAVLAFVFLAPWSLFSGQSRAALSAADADAVGLIPFHTAAALIKVCDTLTLSPGQALIAEETTKETPARLEQLAARRRLVALNPEDPSGLPPIDEFSQETLIHQLAAAIFGSAEYAALAAAYNTLGLPVELQMAFLEDLIRNMIRQGGAAAIPSFYNPGFSGMMLGGPPGGQDGQGPVGGFTQPSSGGGNGLSLLFSTRYTASGSGNSN